MTARRIGTILSDIGANGGDTLVQNAFRNDARAATTDDDRERAEHVLAANVAAVLHEQQRLQDDIAGAIDAGLDDVGDLLAPLVHHLAPRRLADHIVAGARDRVAPHLRQLWEHVSTALLMTLQVPGATLHLGRDVPPLPDGRRFPDALASPSLPTLVRLLDEWDPTRGTGVGSGAGDWCVLHERMGYIVNLFRSRQRECTLTTEPFSPTELGEMERLRVPATLDA